MYPFKEYAILFSVARATARTLGTLIPAATHTPIKDTINQGMDMPRRSCRTCRRTLAPRANVGSFHCDACKLAAAEKSRVRAEERAYAKQHPRCRRCRIRQASPDDMAGKTPFCTRCHMAQEEARYAERLRKVYNITMAEYTTLLDTQKQCCAICHTHISAITTRIGRSMRTLCVDHDHVTGAVRGLLCNTCNTGLGAFYDNPHLLHRAITYLQR
jgi:hypothetical protein